MWASLVVILAVVVAAAVALGLGQRPRFGLDLQGGISAIYTPVFQDGQQPDDLDAVLTQTISVIRQRVDALGVAEPEISRVGSDINVQLPGVTDADRANEIIGKTARLGFHPVARTLAPGTPEYNETPACITEGPGGEDSADWVPSPERPTAQDDGVVCSAELGPSLSQEDLEAPAVPSPDASPRPDPSDGGPDSVAPTTGDPGDRATESAVGPGGQDPMVVAAQQDVSQAPGPGSTAPGTPPATSSTSPQEGPTVAPDAIEDLLSGLDFDDGLPIDAPRPVKYVVDPPPAVDGEELTGSDVESATPGLSQTGYGVSLEFNENGAEAFRIATAEAACDRDDPTNGRPGLVAIVLDDLVESAPTMADSVQCGEGLASGATITTGSEEAAEDLAVVLNAGALPVTLEPTTFTTVSPTLGASSLRSGLVAGLVGLGLVALYLLWFYRGLGLVAMGGLTVFGVLVMGAITVMGRIGFALTLAGVAGIIVSVGITADSSIIFFERIRDEVAVGKTTRLAVARGFDSAFRTNLAGNTVTLVAAVVLYVMAVGPVRGFAFTLGLSTLLDLVIMWMYSRSVVGLLTMRGKLASSIRRRQAADVPAPVTGSGRTR